MTRASDIGGSDADRDQRLAKLAQLATPESPHGFPVHGASVALAHARRGYGCPAPDELAAVLTALDAWDGDRPQLSDLTPGVATPYTHVVTALGQFYSEVSRSIGWPR